jgi:16S rRNA (guanine(966)-N(2))-methyltransferase RsmD
LRVIAGGSRGKRLFSPDGHSIRPTSDKVKGAVFNMIGARIEDAVVVDLFSGSGGLGIEALSRGARRCYFCDNAARARALILKNVVHCGMTDRAELLFCDCKAALGLIREKADVVFLDPPYDCDCHESCLEAMAASACLSAGALAVLEHSATVFFKDAVFGFTKIREKRYGSTGITVFAYGYCSDI